MAEIKANCPDHGDIELTANQMLLITDRQTRNAKHIYRFLCPAEAHYVIKPILDSKNARALIELAVPQTSYDSRQPEGTVVKNFVAQLADIEQIFPGTIDEAI